MPSDESDQVVVTIEAPATLLIRGRTMVLSAHAYERDGDDRTTELPGLVFRWRTSTPELVELEERPDGTALVIPVNEGTADIEAVAAAFESAEPGTVHLRVANPLAIDSVTPSIVRYGEQVTLFGIGVGEIARASLGEADLIPDSGTFSGDPQGEGRLSFWVPYPAASDRLVAISRRGPTAAVPETTTVIFPDLYHELQDPAPRLELDGIIARPPDTLYYNPALAVVPDEGTDALQLHRGEALGSLTVTFTSREPVVALFDPMVTGDPIAPPDPRLGGAATSWSLGFSGHACRESFVDIGRPVAITAPVTLVRALKDLPMRDILLAVYGDPPGGYSVTVTNGYRTADPRIGPDRMEEDDYCAAADRNAADPARAIVLPFADTLTIDNPYEVDWLRFVVPPDPEDESFSVRMTIRTSARPLGASDSSDVTVVITDSLARVVARSNVAGSEEALSDLIRPGPHYLIVQDVAGVPTRYSVCLAEGITCDFLEEPSR
jgi:hypothetical protein